MDATKSVKIFRIFSLAFFYIEVLLSAIVLASPSTRHLDVRRTRNETLIQVNRNMTFSVIRPCNSTRRQEDEDALCRDDCQRSRDSTSRLHPSVDRDHIVLSASRVLEPLNVIIEDISRHLHHSPRSDAVHQRNERVWQHCIRNSGMQDSSSLASQNLTSAEIERDLEVIQICFAVELNNVRLADEFWYNEGYGTRHHEFAEKLFNFLQGPVRQLSCGINQINFHRAMEQPMAYPPVCWRLLATVRNLYVEWPPTDRMRHYEETLRTLGYYRRFLHHVIPYFSRPGRAE